MNTNVLLAADEGAGVHLTRMREASESAARPGIDSRLS
jgi:hypothetical protein